MSNTVRASLVLVAALLLAGCDGSRPSPGPSFVPVRCTVAFEAPPGFREVDRTTERNPAHVGLAVTYSDGKGRTLQFTSGVLRDWYEEAPVGEGVALVGGGEGALFGGGTDWALAWSVPGECNQGAVAGRGFSRDAFMSVLRRSGVLPQQA